jgi:hypothetical protein
MDLSEAAASQALAISPRMTKATNKIVPMMMCGYHEADRLAQLPPTVGHTAAILWGIGKDDAGASAAFFASNDPWNICKGCDGRQAAG